MQVDFHLFLQQFFCDKSSRYGGADLGLALAEKVRKEYNKIKNKQRGKNRLKDIGTRLKKT